LWPLPHDAIEKPRFERSWWRSYQDVSVTFADAAVSALADHKDALTWVHDYHLTLVPGLIRAQLADQPN
jgi:trehalose 6-phosphate synthase